MLRRVITLALAVLLSWTGFSGHEALLPPETNDAFHALAEGRPGSVHHHHLDDLPQRISMDLQDAQDLLALIPVPYPCGDEPGQPPRPHGAGPLPEPWLAIPQRPPRQA